MRTHDPAFNSYDAVKLIALAAMTLDHLGVFLFADCVALRIIGRAAAPLFCILVGYNGQYQFRGWLLFGAVLSSVLSSVYLTLFPLTILWNILITRMLFQRLSPDLLLKKDWQVALVLLLWLPASALLLEYGTLVALWMAWGYALYRQPKGRASWVYGSAATFGSIGMMGTVLGLTGVPLYGMMAVYLLVLGSIHYFTLRPLPGTPACFKQAARYAMEYYLIHLAVMMVTGTALNRYAPMNRLFLW